VSDEYEDLAEMYRPTGSCATGCGHAASEIWFGRIGSQAFTFRCHCCIVKGQLERAQRAADRIPKLKEEYAKAVKECDGK
jgi:hypothetical protein